MPLFWSLAALITLVCMGVLAWPLLRKSTPSNAPDPDAASIAIYRDQKRQLEHERRIGALRQEDYATALAEVERRVAEEVDGDASVSPVRAPAPAARLRPAWIPALVLLAAFPIVAFLLYLRLGSPAAVLTANGAPRAADPKIEAMVDKLAARLKDHPEDTQGWLMLARSYQVLERFPESADAYAHADAVVSKSADLLADYADVLAMAQGQRLAGRPTELIERALALDPKQRKALALAATAALERRDAPGALRYWRSLQSQFEAGSEEYREVAAIIAEIEGVASAAPAPPATRSPPSSAASNAAPGPASSVASGAGSISGQVQLGSAFASRVGADDIVFIYARAAEGSRMPLAIQRLPARSLPGAFVLDDSMGMAPGVKLSDAAEVVVEARISKSGNALPQPGDLFGRSPPLKPGAKGVTIVIDQVVP